MVGVENILNKLNILVIFKLLISSALVMEKVSISFNHRNIYLYLIRKQLDTAS